MESNFKASLLALLKSEGGNDDDKDDHGGRTSRGVTQREYNAWRIEKGLAPRDVWTASSDEIEEIYHSEYWLPWCPLMPVGLDYLYFEMAVNAGPPRATILLQRALGVVDDGRIGPITRQTIVNYPNKVELVNKYSEIKTAFYKSLHQPKYLRGWLNRVSAVKLTALAMLKAA